MIRRWSLPTWGRGLKPFSTLPLPFGLPVAPYMGAWIETRLSLRALRAVRSLPTWGRGLKPRSAALSTIPVRVAPYMGAWIETILPFAPGLPGLVAPYMGAWIETVRLRPSTWIAGSRSLHGGVD